MKKIGIIGGITWESSLEYYRLLNEGIREKLGGQHSAPILLNSFDFQEIEQLQAKGNWEELTIIMVDVAKRLEQAGSDLVIIAANTMHQMAEEVQARLNIPLVHIADSTAKVIKNEGIKKVLLLGTRYTMEMDFYKKRLENSHGLLVTTPNQENRNVIQSIIYNELTRGIINSDSKLKLEEIIMQAKEDGNEGVILGCTELPMLLSPKELPLPSFDTLRLHVKEAMELCLSGLL